VALDESLRNVRVLERVFGRQFMIGSARFSCRREYLASVIDFIAKKWNVIPEILEHERLLSYIAVAPGVGSAVRPAGWNGNKLYYPRRNPCRSS
jgi:hypothetical protein